ncbi:MAG TPA: glycosyltransferase family 9 protein, partial [Isosphaeraceae bacterium]|nr:glycosyltransferase family 9 protein [Isosphaeraceae bacterium]
LIGDTVMSTPVIIEARRLWPEAWITLLGNRQTSELLSACPLVDACAETPVIPFTLRNRRKLAELDSWLREQNFDVAIILLGDQFAQVLADAQIPIRVGVRGHLLAPFLTATYEIGSPREWGPQERLGALRALGHDVRNVSPNLWVSDHARSAAQRRLSELGLSEGVAYAVVHPFGSTPAQWWPPDRTAELAEALHHEHNLWTIVIGGPETRGKLCIAPRNTIDATGAFTISELMAVIENARLVISTDSGPFHIAGALERPLVGLFRARRPEHAGRYPQAKVIFGQAPTCTQRCEWNRCRTTPCRQMNALSLSDVLEAIQGLPARDDGVARTFFGSGESRLK